MPPGGFIFYQPQTNWWAPQGLTFYQVRDEIINHRKKNPRFADQWSTDPDKVADELDFFTCLRLTEAARAQFCTQDTPQTLKKNPIRLLRGWPSNRPIPPQRNGVAAVAGARVENAVAGVGVVLDWLGDSLEPVLPDLAEKRAAVCIQCPQNGRPDFIQRIEGWAASGVRELIELANDLELKTTHDNDLHHCQTCDCALRLKVWCKMEHILPHTPDRVMDSLPAHCWIKTRDQLL